MGKPLPREVTTNGVLVWHAVAMTGGKVCKAIQRRCEVWVGTMMGDDLRGQVSVWPPVRKF